MEVVFLEITPVVESGQPKLKMCHGTDCGTSPGTYPNVNLLENSGSHVFIVSINDPTNKYSFDADALWVQRGHGSPPQKSFDSKGQIASFTKANDKTIFFTDLNDDRLTLGYRLNLKGPNNSSLSIDPDIKNGGGSTVYNFTLVELAFGVAALLLVGLFLRPVLRWIFR